ncbi:probable asparagine--tRNA ligase, mitochondrial [Centruroides sculpturatus]|uniref:probable asparagine--tRNA ligase, mitochondrial n=1 Tax=Centruroides sculpturatus TaxID=218467 RepID=UPI000C6E7413|nr:probable asparagine--tRNA ligase, mitochondrial [Centruroides sculpturatus]
MKILIPKHLFLRRNNCNITFSCIKNWSSYVHTNLEPGNVNNKNFTVKELLTLKPIEREISVKGWIKALRKHKNIMFIDINDGSCLENLQVIDENGKTEISFGCSVQIEGVLAKSTHKNQEVELKCCSLNVLGKCDGLKFPFLPRHSPTVKETRQHLHLRPRTKDFGALLRIRSLATFAVHKFLQERNFLHVNTPIITSNDCEGGGDVFSVQVNPVTSNLIDENISSTECKHYFNVPAYLTVSGQLALEAAACAMSKVYTFGPTFRAENTRTRRHLCEFQMIEVEQTFVTLEDLFQLTEELFKSSAQYILEKCVKDVELFHSCLTPCYAHHLTKILETPFISGASCFDLIAPFGGEICGGSLREDDENQLKIRIRQAGIDSETLQCIECPMELEMSENLSDKGKVLEISGKLVLNLEKEQNYYSLMLNILKFQWGEKLFAEHEDFLLKYCKNIPIFIKNFPINITPFYMKMSSEKTASCFDLIAPFGGEICGGSLREDDENQLKIRIRQAGIDSETLQWYIELREFGSVPHGGFGMGFDRFLQTVLAIPNIREVVPFPRWSHHCQM